MEKDIFQKQNRLNVGCGRNIMEGWINLDIMMLDGVDIIADLDDCANTALPIEDNMIDEFLLSHVIEHINSPLPLMQELYRIAKPSAKLMMRGKIQHTFALILQIVFVTSHSHCIGVRIMVIEVIGNVIQLHLSFLKG